MLFSFSPRPAAGERRFRLVSLVLVASAPLFAACVTPDPANASSQTAVDGRVRDVDFHHDPCEPDGDSKTVDVNGDGPSDIIHVMKGGREVCRIVDLNFDGAVDVYIYYDDRGAERRREADFDRDGRPDQVSIYRGGQLVENHRETNYDDKIDTWDYYQNAVLVRRERDSDGDAITDQWWQFYDPSRPKCALVATDHNVDGKPDADNQVDLCGTGQPVTGVGAPPPGAPTAPQATAAPTAAVTTGPQAAPNPGAPSAPGAQPTPPGAQPAPPSTAPSPSPAPQP